MDEDEDEANSVWLRAKPALDITDHRSPITDHRLPITDYLSPITYHLLRAPITQ
jgi:hypothetical protein